MIIQAEAIQAANFTPDFAAMSPWGNQLIRQCIHEENGTMTCKKPQTKLTVEFNGKAHKLLAVPGDFFTNLGTAMPGDVLTDTITLSNTTDDPAELLFRTSVKGRSEEKRAMLKDVKLTVAMGNEILYRGNLESTGLEKNRSLGRFASGQTGNMKFRLEIPTEWDNRMAQKSADVTWIFTVNEKVKEIVPDTEETSGKKEDSGRTTAAKDGEGRKKAHVKTGDLSSPGFLFALLIASGGLLLMVKTWKGGRRT